MLAEDIDWKLTPPASPYIQKMIRNNIFYKYYLKNITTIRGFTGSTHLVRKHTVKNRPITYVSSDTEHLESLTPIQSTCI